MLTVNQLVFVGVTGWMVLSVAVVVMLCIHSSRLSAAEQEVLGK